MRRVLFGLLAAALALSATPATAHRQVIQSPENPDAKRVDIESVEVAHPQGVIRFVVTFRDAHPMSEGGASLSILFRTTRKPPIRRRSVDLRRNPDGSLIGQVRTFPRGRVRGFANIYVPDARTVVVELHRQQLRFPRLARFMDWKLTASYIDEQDCPTVGDVLGQCVDTVPERPGLIFHRFAQ